MNFISTIDCFVSRHLGRLVCAEDSERAVLKVVVREPVLMQAIMFSLLGIAGLSLVYTLGREAGSLAGVESMGAWFVFAACAWGGVALGLVLLVAGIVCADRDLLSMEKTTRTVRHGAGEVPHDDVVSLVYSVEDHGEDTWCRLLLRYRILTEPRLIELAHLKQNFSESAVRQFCEISGIPLEEIYGSDDALVNGVNMASVGG